MATVVGWMFRAVILIKFQKKILSLFFFFHEKKMRKILNIFLWNVSAWGMELIWQKKKNCTETDLSEEENFYGEYGLISLIGSLWHVSYDFMNEKLSVIQRFWGLSGLT